MRRLLDHFGVPQRTTYMSDLFKLYSGDIVNAVREHQMIALVGQFCAGKSELFRHAVSNLVRKPDNAPVFIHVRSKDKERLRIGHMMSAICLDLGESPRRDQEARARQVIRLLGEKYVSQKRTICVVVENSHGLHPNTLMAIKDLREDDFAGVSPLLSVVLIGQEQLKVRLSQKKEVLYRTKMIELNESCGWMTMQDRIGYIKHIYGESITPTARERIATLWKVPGEIDYHILAKMRDAQKGGYNRLTEDAFEVTPQEMLKALNAGLSTKDEDYVSLSKIANEAGVGKTTVSDVLAGRPSNQGDAVEAALQRLSQKRTTEDQPVRKVA